MEKLPQYSISLTRGLSCLVDEADYATLASHKWCVMSDGYAGREVSKGKTVSMHRIIMNAKKGEYVDHINHDIRDNRRCNLRICTAVESLRNRRKLKAATSRYKGVSWNKVWNKWQVAIRAGGNKMSLGCFTDEDDAATVYNVAAQLFHGDYAVLNSIPH